MRGVRFLCWKNNKKRKRKSEEQEGETAGGGGVSARGQRQAPPPPSSLAIAARLVAFCPSPGPGRSSGSRSVAAGDARAPAPSTAPRPARRHCPGQSPSAWGRRRWGRWRASGGLLGGEEEKETGWTLLVLVWDAGNLMQHQVAVNDKYGVFQHYKHHSLTHLIQVYIFWDVTCDSQLLTHHSALSISRTMNNKVRL